MGQVFVKAAKYYLKNGINCIVTNNVKQSLFPWVKYRKEFITIDEFEKQTQHKSAAGLAVICGSVSGGLEVIDIDLKYSLEHNFYKKFCDEIGEDIMQKLYIVQTKSGGYHFYYRCELIEGNQKVCYRYATDNELIENPSTKKICIIETRGEGGYVIAPPTDGYKVVSEHREIPVLTIDEREAIFSAARSLNEVHEVKEIEVRNNTEIKDFGVSPFEAYNKGGDVIGLLQQHGWKVVGENSERVWFLRPGNTTAKSSGNFNKEKNWFSVFTTNSCFEPERAYQPAAVFAMLECNNDFKLAARKLIDMGFGERRVSYGNKIEKEVFKARKEGQSDQEIAEYLVRKHNKQITEAQDIVKNITNQKDICTFWEISEKGHVNIVRQKLIDFMYNEGGFCLYFHNSNKVFQLVRVMDGMVEETTTEQLKKFIKDYIMSLPPFFDNGLTPDMLLELIMKGSNVYFSDSLIEFIDSKQLNFLKDEVNKAYYPFRNGVVVVEKNKIPVLKTYGDINKHVWKNQVIDFNIVIDHDFDAELCEYFRFVYNISGKDENRLKYALTLIGYMLHGFKNPSRPFAPILAEETDDEKKGGGTGKGLFIKALGKLIPIVTIDGKNFKIDKTFAFQRVGFDTRLVVIEDCPKNVNFEKFYPTITEGITIEKKNKDEIFLPYSESPKIGFTTNYTISQDAEHAKRRQRVFEFASHYSSKFTPEDEFGHKLFDDWDRDEWNRFYNLFFQCVGMYLDAGIIVVENSEKMKRKHIKLAYGEEFLEYFDDLTKVTKKWYSITEEHNSFMQANSLTSRDYSMKRFRKALQETSNSLGFSFETRKNRQISNITEFCVTDLEQM